MTGMEHAIERVADAMWGAIDDTGIRGRLYREDCDYLAHVLASAGLLAPIPLGVAWAVKWDDGHVWDGYLDRAQAVAVSDATDTPVRRYVSDWEPADRAEGDGEADCGCARCDGERLRAENGPWWAGSKMYICPDCGSKRCPRAASHDRPCDGRADL